MLKKTDGGGFVEVLNDIVDDGNDIVEVRIRIVEVSTNIVEFGNDIVEVGIDIVEFGNAFVYFKLCLLNAPVTYYILCHTDSCRSMLVPVTVDIEDCPPFAPNVFTPNNDGFNDFYAGIFR